MVYDLGGSAGRLTLRVIGRGRGDGPPTEWRIEASMSTSPDAVVVAEEGATRAEALRALGRSWNDKRLANNLPSFDWESVARAMAAVGPSEGRGRAGMNDNTLEQIRVAKNGVADAENDLAWLLAEIEAAPRAEKTILSEALRKALQKLVDARERLGKLETMLLASDD